MTSAAFILAFDISISNKSVLAIKSNDLLNLNLYKVSFKILKIVTNVKLLKIVQNLKKICDH